MNIKISLLIAFFCVGTAFADNVNVPKVVQDAFAKAYPSVTKVTWEDDGGNYEAKFRQSKRDLSVIYAADGALIETEEEMHERELPKIITSEAHKAHPKARFNEFAKITRADGSIVYEVEIQEGGKETDLLYTPDGKPSK